MATIRQRSTVFTRSKASIDVDRGATSKPWSSSTLEWADWFNHCHLLEPIGNIPFAEAEERYYTMLELPAMGA
jgi:hypothetical protein